MGFLDSLGGVLGSIGSVAGSIGNIASLFQDNDNPALNVSTKSLDEARLYALAASDPKNAKFRNLAAIIEENLRNQSIRGLQDLMIQNRRDIAKGNRGIFANPERRDEALANAFLEQQHAAGLRAHDYAQQSLGNTAQRLAGNVASAGPTVEGLQRQFEQGQNNLRGAFASGGQIAKTLGDVVINLGGSPATKPTARGYSDFMYDKAHM